MTAGRDFAHASEAELARILDFYQVRWEYEPRTFPIMWNLDGVVVESFSPDFYLPELDLYLELTTLKQSLVRKKNRKLRRLRELYPDLRVKLFYARDFKALLLKYGRLDSIASLTGLEGQARPGDRQPARSSEAAMNAHAAARSAGEGRSASGIPASVGPTPSAGASPTNHTHEDRSARGRGSRRRRNRRLSATLPARPA